MNPLYVAWRTAMKKVWKLPRTTHNDYISIIADVVPPNLMLEKRTIKFIKNLMRSDNATVKTITGMAINGYQSVLAKNYKYLLYNYNLDIANVYRKWKSYCLSHPESIRICDQINELITMRDSFDEYFLSQSEAKDIIDFLCTD